MRWRLMSAGGVPDRGFASMRSTMSRTCRYSPSGSAAGLGAALDRAVSAPGPRLVAGVRVDLVHEHVRAAAHGAGEGDRAHAELLLRDLHSAQREPERVFEVGLVRVAHLLAQQELLQRAVLRPREEFFVVIAAERPREVVERLEALEHLAVRVAARAAQHVAPDLLHRARPRDRERDRRLAGVALLARAALQEGRPRLRRARRARALRDRPLREAILVDEAAAPAARARREQLARLLEADATRRAARGADRAHPRAGSSGGRCTLPA